MILHFGVVDLPYSTARGKRAKRAASNTTTGDVAGFLENKYHVMENFYQLHPGEIARDLEKSLAGTLENLLMGGPPPVSPFNEAVSSIENRFRKFLDNAEMEKIGFPGVPTQAALDGVNHRKKRPNAKTNPRRPSFLDTTLYQSSFKAWVET